MKEAKPYQKKAAPGPGPVGSPLREVVSRHWPGDGFLMAVLECGHEVRVTKEYTYPPKGPRKPMIPCGECPRIAQK